jgi:transcription initiation factor IIE alpha subunit
MKESIKKLKEELKEKERGCRSRRTTGSHTRFECEHTCEAPFLCPYCEEDVIELKAKIKILEKVIKTIKIKMRHENRNQVLSILSDLCGEIKGA